MKNSITQNQFYSYLLKLTKPKEINGVFSNLVLALPRILAGFFLATMFGGDKFGVPWSFSDTGLGLFEVVDWFPEDVAKFGFPFTQVPVLFAWLGAASEAIGGMFLLWGFQTRISGFLISCTMLVAIFLQKWGGPLWNMLPALGFLWVGLYAIAFGSGKFGLDYLVARKMKSLKFGSPRIKTKIIASLVLVVSLIGTGNSLAQVKGNGNIITQRIEVGSFSKLNNGLSSNYKVVIGDKREVKITIDENLIDLLEIKVIDGELNIDQGKWISSSTKIIVEISTPTLTQFINSAHGSYDIKGISTDTFIVDAQVGDVSLSGIVEKLVVETNVGKINALNLIASSALVNVTSFGVLKLNVVEELEANVSSNGKIIYAQKPDTLKSKTVEGGRVLLLADDIILIKEVTYIDVRLKNNSADRINLILVGPEEANFSYGITLNIFQSRKERFPIGTKIYLERSLANNRLIAEIKEQDAGQTVKLF